MSLCDEQRSWAKQRIKMVRPEATGERREPPGAISSKLRLDALSLGIPHRTAVGKLRLKSIHSFAYFTRQLRSVSHALASLTLHHCSSRGIFSGNLSQL